MREIDVPVGEGRTVRAYDSGAISPGGLALVWLPGSPHTGAPLPPLLSAAAQRGIRLITLARPSYGRSTPHPGRTIASGAADAARVVDALEMDRFAVMGYSGGAPHALACAAVLPDRVIGVVTLAGFTPYTVDFDWFAGMASNGALRAALAGRRARARYAETNAFDPDTFTAADWATLSGAWAPLGEDAQAAEQAGPDGLIDDDVALVAPWGIDLTGVTVPVLLVHGDEDRVAPYAHSRWLRGRLPRAELWTRRGAGHVAVLDACPDAMDWLAERTDAP